MMYRHGQCVTIKMSQHNHHGSKEDDSKPAEVEVQRICDIGIGSVYLILSKCIVLRHSDQLLFFKRERST